ncbi:MAG: ABC transporter permease [Acidobacteriaceae bacterium]
MSALSVLGRGWRKLGVLLRGERFGGELDEEMAFHREQAARELEAQGMSREEARYAAMRQFGNATRLRERSHEVMGFRMETVAQDVRFAVRQMRRSPGFAVTAVLMLTLGMGASVAIFGFVDAALIQPLPYAQPNRLVDVTESLALFPRGNLSYPDYVDWKRMNTVFSSLAAYQGVGDLLRGPNGTETVSGMEVSANFLRTLGMEPAMGRDFHPGEDAVSAPATLLLTYRGWQKWFGGRKDVVGQTVQLSGEPVTVIGVLPRSFVFALGGNPQYLKILQQRHGCVMRRSCHSLYGVGRLKDGVTVAAAREDMKAIAAQLAKVYPDSNRGQGASVMPLAQAVTGDIRPILLVLLGGAGLLLLIACVNVSNLLLVRAEKRRKEMAVRGALGASRRRLIRQTVTEAGLLGAAGWAVALPLADATMRVLRAMIAKNQLDSMPYLQGLGMTRDVWLFAAAVAAMAGALFSVAPILRLPAGHLREDLNEGGRGGVGRVWKRLGGHLVIAEMAIAVVLVAGAGLLAKSLWRMLHVELGFVPEHLAMMNVELPDAEYPKPAQQAIAAQAIVERVRRLPGVQDTAVTTVPPVTCNCDTDWIRFVGKPYNGVHNEVNDRQISAEFFTTIQARLVRGRFFTEADDAQHPKVVVINEALAQKYFPGEDPIGQTIGDTDLKKDSLRKIVGVVANIREGALDSEEWPTEYESFTQDPDTYFALMVRTAGDAKALLPEMAAAIRQLNRSAGVEQETTMEARIHDSGAAWLHRSAAWLVGGFAGLALLLSAIGLYGVIAYSVSQRTREIGVRMALGAERSAVRGMILREAGWLAAAGIALGLGGAVGAASLMHSLLFGVRAWDVSTLAAVAVVLGVSALVASYLPARRAAGVEPMEALRSE